MSAARMTLDEVMKNAEEARGRVMSRELAPSGRNLVVVGGSGVYAGGRMTRLEQDWIAKLRSADEELKRDFPALRARGREIYRNNPLGRQYGRLVDLNVVGHSGPMHRPRIRDNNRDLSPRLNRVLKEAFAQWCEESVTLDGTMDWVGLQRRQAPGARVEGECLIRYWTGPQVQNDFGLLLEPIDPDQLDHTYNRPRSETENEVVMGVEYDQVGRRVAYHIFDSPESFARLRNRERVSAREIQHIYDPARVWQSRGITDFHAAMLDLHFAGMYLEYELVAMRMGAARPIVWKKIVTPNGWAASQPSKDELAGRTPIELLEPGEYGFAPDGYEPANVTTDHPSTAFEAMLRECNRRACTSLGVGYMALTGDLTQTSFSSARSGTLLERDTWRTMQQWWIRQWVKPIYRTWLREAMTLGAETGGMQGIQLDMRSFRRLSAVTFTPRGYDYVNPLQDANAIIALIANGLWSRHRALDEMQIDIEELFDELGEENKMAAKRNIMITEAAAMQLARSEKLAVSAEKDAEGPVATQKGDQPTSGRAGEVHGLANRIAALLVNAGQDRVEEHLNGRAA